MTSLSIRPGVLQIKGGVFDSRNKHLRQVANVAQMQFWMVQGRTVETVVVKNAQGRDWLVGWRYEIGPYTNKDPQFQPLPGYATSKRARV